MITIHKNKRTATVRNTGNGFITEAVSRRGAAAGIIVTQSLPLAIFAAEWWVSRESLVDNVSHDDLEPLYEV